MRERRKIAWPLVLSLSFLLAVGCKPALREIFNVPGPRDFGVALDGLGDVNGDQIPDFVIGSPPGNGQAVIVSGAPGSPELQKYSGGLALGRSVSAIGDADGDGVTDVLIGSGTNSTLGDVFVFGSVSGLFLYDILGEAFGACFGDAVAGLDDVDGLGRADLLVGAPDFVGAAGVLAGKIHVFSGDTRLEYFSLEGEGAGDRLGRSVSDATDFTGDAIGDAVVGAPGHDGPAGADAGRVYLVSGATGAIVRTIDGGAAGDNFGRAVSGAGDVDGDSVGDVIVGSIGAAAVRSGADGSAIHAWTSGFVDFGRAVSDAGDVDGDGVPDLIVGSAGEAVVYSGASGGQLDRLFVLDRQLTNGDLGAAVAAAGDVNGDGRDDVLVGAPDYHLFVSEPVSQGAAFVFSVPASPF